MVERQQREAFEQAPGRPNQPSGPPPNLPSVPKERPGSNVQVGQMGTPAKQAPYTQSGVSKPVTATNTPPPSSMIPFEYYANVSAMDWASVYGGMSRQQKRPKARNTRVSSLENVPITITPKGPLTDKEEIETYLIRMLYFCLISDHNVENLIQSYFNIVRKNIQDTIPKAIMHLLVNKSKKLIHNRLVEKLYRDEKLEELLSETPEVAARRSATKQMVEMLKKAQEILNEVRDYSLK